MHYAWVTSNHGPRTILSPVRFLARKATGPVRLATVVHLRFDRIIRRTPRVPLAMPARASHGNLQRFSYPTGPMRDPQGCRTTPLRTRKGIDTARIGKNPARASYLAVRGPYGTLRAPHGLFTGCSRSQNPYGARKLIMHALKLYGHRTGRQNSYGAIRGPHGRTIFVQNSPGTARTGPGSVMWLGHYLTGPARV